ncbi:MAG: hypothetical protein SGILL_000356 [Bacillariaceae sp.]
MEPAEQQQTELASARKGLLKAIWSTMAPRFSSKPIIEDYLLDSDGAFRGSVNASGGSRSSDNASSTERADDVNSVLSENTAAAEKFRNSLHQSSHLTKSEQNYLQQLLRSDDLDSIRRASTRLADKEIFPAAEDPSETDDMKDTAEAKREAAETDAAEESKSRKVMKRRDSQVQQQLFQLHEKTTIMPSAMLKRMSGVAASKASRPLFVSLSNSLTQDDGSSYLTEQKQEETSSKDLHQAATTGSNNNHNEEKQAITSIWNPLKDLNTWIDGSEGVEVDDEGTPEISSPTSNPFKILGTSANDTSCHPHVLSPPLMEGLQLFMPESLQENHYWLKYSLVRDGPSLIRMLRHCRASQHTILAIETTDGHVFGSFTSCPWRLTSTKGYYGSKESFVWRMRRSRNEEVESVMEQILMESKIDVFPFTGRNHMVQLLCTNQCIALGHGELKDDSIGGDKVNEEAEEGYYGLAIKLDKSMETGTTSSSETFGNPCLIQRESRGVAFEVANVELWSMTPHVTVEQADHAEMKELFLEENRHAGDRNLNLIEILVGGAHI